MIKEYTRYMDQLDGSYKECFNKIENIILEYKLTNEEYDNVMSEFLDILLCAQEDNKSCTELFGTDIKSFCKDYINSLFPYYQITNFFASIVSFAAIILLFSFGNALLSKINGTIQNIMYDKFNGFLLLGFIFGILSAGINSFYNRRKPYLKSAKHPIIKYILILTVIVGIGTIFLAIFDKSNITFMVYMGDIWPIIAAIMFLGFSGIITMKILEGNNHSNIDESVLKAIKKEYERKKRNKGWSEQEYINWYRKFCSFWHPILIFELIIFMIILLAAFSLCIIHTGTIAVLGIVLMLAFEIFISSAIITSAIRSKKIVCKLMAGKIKLSNK